ncbi:hypothetical protein J5N97_000555 [Dioscorea zingiberensis]|uniref:F-box/kelch-repeat protein n=1 Tax=Dioscorea zingiberensis TaxID=325984 RepID=A0A9D5BV90_9LILI|nr:hypothetical protein J5N97_000555 [Dioscorea zingiberensis]
MVPYIGVVHEGRWFLKGLGPHRQVHSEVYLPETESWSPVLDGMVSGWRNPCACVNGRLYALDCKDGCKLRVYNDAADSWSNHMDSGLHLGSSQALEAAALVPLCGKLCIVRNNMSMSLVDVASEGGRWETLAVAGGRGNNLKSWATNIWFTLGLGGYKHGKSHILHCQVLQSLDHQGVTLVIASSQRCP